MGNVYEARDRERQQRVAIKTLVDFDPASLLMFKREFRTLADVHHPNLVRLHELVVPEGDRVFFSMELVRGGDFVKYVQRPAAHNAAASAVVINGQPLSSPARPASPADLDRLRPALRQLAEGVQALHAAGKLHRDIKPPNVLVTPEGRVVVLDFGVATELPRVADPNLREEGAMVGTADYMAPEQAFDDECTPASDWYSVGVVLYEALVGRPPFSGSAHEVIAAKNSEDAPAPSAMVDGVPADLDALCKALLDVEASRRPTGPEVLRRVGASRGSGPAPAASLGAAGHSLVGREKQLRSLRDAFELARSSRPITVHVSGRAGMGKSALVQHFTDGLVESGEAVVLYGRVYERESIPFKAVDAIIDALSRYLMRVSDAEGTVVLPREVAALARLFPVLGRLPGVNEGTGGRVLDPHRVRRRAFAALRELVTTLATRTPLVLCIDDVQWGDTDSANLLLELVKHPYAPPILLIMSHREEDARTSPFLTDVRGRWPLGAESRDISVGPLSVDEARGLASAILGADASQSLADEVARESGGSPFLVEELARSSNGLLRAADGFRLSLEQMVSERLSGLPADARRVAELVAVGGRPLPVSVVGNAAGMRSTDDAVALLSERRFVRGGLRDGREVIEPVHDRVRETIVGLLPSATLRDHHGSLARALEGTAGADPEALAVHLLGAGETERGSRVAEQAAEQAATQLAFDQAARLYRLTVDTLPASSPRRRDLLERLGQTLGWAGRSEEAGRAYLAAAAESTVALERFQLERAASEQLLAAGRIEEGGQVLRRLLTGAGVKAPVSPLSAVFWLVMYKLRLKILGLKFGDRAPDAVSRQDHARLSALNVAALGLASVDTILAACMQARQMVETLRRGDRGEVLRAAVIYGIHLATRGGVADKHERELHETIARLSASASSEEVAFARGTNGVCLFLRGRWRQALSAIDEAYANMQGQVAGWQSQAGLYAVYALVFLGEFTQLRRRYARALADADQRGDLFTSVQLRASHPTVLLLAADDPDGARRQTGEAKAQWTQQKFLTQHWQIMRSEAEIEIYVGEGTKAYERLQRDEAALKRSLLLKVQFIRVLTDFVRGRAAITSIGRCDPPQRAARIAEARRLARNLEGERMAWAAPLAAILDAATDHAEGRKASAVPSLEKAIKTAEAAEMAIYAASARHQLGLALGGDRGSEMVRQAEHFLRSQDIQAPARFASMLVPGRWADETGPTVASTAR